MVFSNTQLEKYADVLIWGLTTARTGKFKPYDTILIRYELPALDLAEVIHRKLVEKKFNVVVRALNNSDMEKNFYDCSDETQRDFIPAGEDVFYQNLNGNIYLSAPESLTHLKDIDPKKITQTAISRKKLREIMERREEQGKFGWTLCTYPTPALAIQAGMSLTQYTRQVIRACFLDETNPVKKWQEIFTNAQSIKRWLNNLPIKTIHLGSKHLDLNIKLGDRRKFIGISGHNIPSFELFTSPDWRGTSGTYHADFPSYRSGNRVEKVTLEFDKGSVIKATASKGEQFLKKMVGMDAGAGRIGEFSLTDIRFSKIDRFMADTLFDENIGGIYGNCHIAIGASYSDTYDGNPKLLTKERKKALGFNDSALHWDLVNTENKTVTATLKNGKSVVIYEKGLFKY
jgi:aminopeptidase